jgi:hypothetical protein
METLGGGGAGGVFWPAAAPRDCGTSEGVWTYNKK